MEEKKFFRNDNSALSIAEALSLNIFWRKNDSKRLRNLLEKYLERIS